MSQASLAIRLGIDRKTVRSWENGSWVDAHGDLYLSLTAEQRVDKYIRRG